MRRVIVNADDFGRSPAVNAAIGEVVRNGIVTSTTVMANMPGALEVADLKVLRPDISLGLHVNLTEGRPVAGAAHVPSLIDGHGLFLGWEGFLKRLWTGKVRIRDILSEVSAQMGRLKGIAETIDHVDSHQHVHLMPPVLWAILRVGRRYGISRIRTNRRYFVSSAAEARPNWRLFTGHLRHSPLSAPGLALKLTQGVLSRYYEYCRPGFLVTPCPRIAPRPLEPALLSWARVFERLPDGLFEINCHPGGEIEGETELLSDRRLRELVASTCIQLVTFKDL